MVKMAEINKQKDIKVINDSVEAVRKLPDVYIGALGNHGYLNMYREILQNSLDEIIKGNTLNKDIIVSFDARNHTCIVEDNGQGIKLDMLAPVFSVLHSSSNYDKVEGSGDYSSGKNGMGATITNFLSKFFVVESYRMDGTAAKVEFKEGKLSSKGTQNIKCPKGKHGLITSFAPSDMMGEITVDDVEIEKLTWLICHLCTIGTRITFNAINNLGQKRSVIIENKHGIFELINGICEKKVFDPVYFTEDNGSMKVEVLFTYDIMNMDDPNILSFANMCPTTTGTHVEGFLDAIIKYFKDYMNKIYLVNNKKKLTVNAQDIRTGLRAVISVFHIKPMFTGQSKEVFSKTDMKPYINEVTTKALDKWASANPADLQKICKYLKEVCEIRSKTDNEKIKMSDKYTSSVVSGLPAKYKKPNSNKNFELWITEGDSATSCMENNRDKSCQGLFPIKGKIINAFTTPTKRYFENEEVAGIFKIFGYNGYSKKFDISKFKPSKVVIATDADADGKHIECLLFGLFLKYIPEVIEQGKLYVANPPLYGISLGKNKMKFFADNIEYIEYVQSIFCKENVITNLKNKSYNKKEITKILYNNIDYVSQINHVSSIYSIDPYLLEFILYNRELSYTKFKSVIENKNKFLKVTNENGTIMIRGLFNSAYQTIFYNQRLLNDCAEIINMINRSEDYYKMNGKTCTIYELMLAFNNFKPKNLTRYKGLGEMPPKMLGISTVIPGSGRILKQYTITDVKKELKLITELQNDKSAFTKGIKVRKEDII
jgi:DNA gyrase/topoisomerase IV subunit B